MHKIENYLFITCRVRTRTANRYISIFISVRQKIVRINEYFFKVKLRSNILRNIVHANPLI